MMYNVNGMVDVEVVVEHTEYENVMMTGMYFGNVCMASCDFSVGNATCDMENENAAFHAVFEEVFGGNYTVRVV